MDIYWIRDKKRCGPSTVPDIISLVQMGELTRDTLGWHKGCEKWIPLYQLPALADFLDELQDCSRPDTTEEDAFDPSSDSEPQLSEGLPPLPPKNTLPAPPPGADRDAPIRPANEQGEAPPIIAKRVYLPSPGARFLARCVDYSLYLSLFYMTIYAMGIEFDRMLTPDSYLVWLPCIIIEGIYLSHLNTTPGKALMGIRMSVFGDVEHISVLRGAIRSLLVFLLGCGMMLLPVALVMGILTLWMLRNRGITSWDARCSTLPVQVRPASTERILAAFGIIFISLIAVGCFLTPWTQPMLQALEEQQPGITQKLSPLLPPQYTESSQEQGIRPQPYASPARMAPAAPAAPSTSSPTPVPGTTASPAVPAPSPSPAPSPAVPAASPSTAPSPTLLESLRQDPRLSTSHSPAP